MGLPTADPSSPHTRAPRAKRSKTSSLSLLSRPCGGQAHPSGAPPFSRGRKEPPPPALSALLAADGPLAWPRVSHGHASEAKDRASVRQELSLGQSELPVSQNAFLVEFGQSAQFLDQTSFLFRRQSALDAPTELFEELLDRGLARPPSAGRGPFSGPLSPRLGRLRRPTTPWSSRPCERTSLRFTLPRPPDQAEAGSCGVRGCHRVVRTRSRQPPPVRRLAKTRLRAEARRRTKARPRLHPGSRGKHWTSLPLRAERVPAPPRAGRAGDPGEAFASPLPTPQTPWSSLRRLGRASRGRRRR
jgi:hypothetical protein